MTIKMSQKTIYKIVFKIYTRELKYYQKIYNRRLKKIKKNMNNPYYLNELDEYKININRLENLINIINQEL